MNKIVSSLIEFIKLLQNAKRTFGKVMLDLASSRNEKDAITFKIKFLTDA